MGLIAVGLKDMLTTTSWESLAYSVTVLSLRTLRYVLGYLGMSVLFVGDALRTIFESEQLGWIADRGIRLMLRNLRSFSQF